MRIYHTTYDGYYITVSDKGRINEYEGFDLCPKNVQKMIKRDGAMQLDCFHYEAISFGLVK